MTFRYTRLNAESITCINDIRNSKGTFIAKTNIRRQ